MILDWGKTLLTFYLDLVWGGGNASNPLLVDIPPYEITADMITHVQKSVLLSELIWQEDLQNDLVTEVFEDTNDRVLVRYDSGTCYVAFKGAWTGNPADIIQSVPLPFAPEVCGSAGCCRVEQGMKNAYYSKYVEEFEDSVFRCLAQCTDGCPLVITGHSQGASIAPVAAIALAEYNPILLTFGQHMTQIGSCPVLQNMETYLRFNGMCEVNGGPTYDNLPHWGNTLRAQHSGTHILLSNGGAATLGYNTDMVFLPFLEVCHSIFDPYMSSIAKLRPGKLDGFVEGALCTRNIECRSRECRRKRCTA